MAPPTRPAPGSTRTPTPRPPISCPSTASTTSSSGSATPARPRPTTARCGASRRSPSAASRPKVRDRASYVMVQNDIRFVFTAPLTPDGEIAEHVRAHGDGVHDIAFAVDDVESAWRETTTRGAASALEPTELDGGEDGVLRTASIRTYGEVLHSFVDRRDYHGVVRAGLPARSRSRRAPRAGCRCSRSTTASATSSSARWTRSSTSTATSSASPSSSTTTTRSSTPTTAR